MRKTVLFILCSALLMAGCSAGSGSDVAVSSAAVVDDSSEVSSGVSESERNDARDVGRPTEDWSERYDRIIAMVYGDDFHMAYSMEDIVGTADDDNFLCDYSKLTLSVENNCVLLAQETGDGAVRTVKYDIDVLSGECAIIYDSDDGSNTVVWSGKGTVQGTATITLSDGANCLRLKALDDDTRLKVSLQCVE